MAKQRDRIPPIPDDQPQAFAIPKEQQLRNKAARAAEDRARATSAEQIKNARKERERINNARARFVQTTELSHLFSDWETLKDAGADAGFSRDEMRRVDMHVAYNDPHLLNRLREQQDGMGEFFAFLDQTVLGSAHEPTAADLMTNDSRDPFALFRTMSAYTGTIQVEQGVEKRTRTEHQRIRVGVEAAAQATSIRNFLHVLDTQIGAELGSKFTSYERAVLHDQLELILAGRDWPHPTQEMARSFFHWESIFGDEPVTAATHVTTYTPARFKPEHGTTTSQPHRAPSFWRNLANAPSDIGKMIFNEDGARTGKTNKKKE